MALQSGLTPIDGEDEGIRPEIVKQRGRVQVRDDSSPFVALKPQAKPYDNYARPERAPIDNSLQSLAEGLSSFNHALQQWADVSAKENKKGAGDAAARFIAGRKPEEVQADITAGRVPEQLRNRFGMETLRNQQALAQADADALYFQDWYAKASPEEKATYRDKIAAMVAQRAKEYGNQDGFQELYNTRMAAATNHLDRLDLARKQEDFQFQQASATQNAALGILRTVADQGLDPKNAKEGINTLFQSNKDWQRLSFKDQQQNLLDAVPSLLGDLERSPYDKERRDRIVAAVKEVLTGERVDEKNGIKTRLIEAPGGIGVKAQALLAQLESKQGELNNKQYYGDRERWEYNAKNHPEKVDMAQVRKWKDQYPGVGDERFVNHIEGLRQAAIDRLGKQAAEQQAESQAQGFKNQQVAQDVQALEDGNFFRVEDKKLPSAKSLMTNDSTNDETFTADQRKKEALKAFKNRLDYERNQFINQKVPKEQVDDYITARELDRYSQNMIVPDDWKEDMKAGFRQMTTIAGTGKAPPEVTLQQFRRYNLMAEKYPNLVREATDDTTREFYDMARAARSAGYSTDQAALQAAAQYMVNRDKDREKITQNEITDQLAKLDDTWLPSILGGKETIENPNLLRGKVAQQASLYATAFGLKPKDAIKAAVQNARGHYAIVNGYAIDTNDKRLPPDFEALAKDQIEEVYKKYQKDLNTMGVNSAKDLYLAPAGEGSDIFHIVSKGRMIGTLGALVQNAWDDQVVTPEKLDAARERIRTRQIKNATDPQQKALRRTQGPVPSATPREDEMLR